MSWWIGKLWNDNMSRWIGKLWNDDMSRWIGKLWNDDMSWWIGRLWNDDMSWWIGKLWNDHMSWWIGKLWNDDMSWWIGKLWSRCGLRGKPLKSNLQHDEITWKIPGDCAVLRLMLKQSTSKRAEQANQPSNKHREMNELNYK